MSLSTEPLAPAPGHSAPPATPPPRRVKRKSTYSAADGLLLIGDVAARLNCSPRTVRKLVKDRKLPVVRLTGSRTEPLRFRALDVARLVHASTEGANAAVTAGGGS